MPGTPNCPWGSFSRPVIVDRQKKKYRTPAGLAFHNRRSRELMLLKGPAEQRQDCAFDISFHQTIPKKLICTASLTVTMNATELENTAFTVCLTNM